MNLHELKVYMVHCYILKLQQLSELWNRKCVNWCQISVIPSSHSMCLGGEHCRLQYLLLLPGAGLYRLLPDCFNNWSGWVPFLPFSNPPSHHYIQEYTVSHGELWKPRAIIEFCEVPWKPSQETTYCLPQGGRVTCPELGYAAVSDNSEISEG